MENAIDVIKEIDRALGKYARGGSTAERTLVEVSLALRGPILTAPPVARAEPVDDATAKRIAAARERLPPMIVDFIDAVASIARDEGK